MSLDIYIFHIQGFHWPDVQRIVSLEHLIMAPHGILSIAHTKKENCLSDSYQTDKNKCCGYPQVNGNLLNLKCTLTQFYKAVLIHSAEK